MTQLGHLCDYARMWVQAATTNEYLPDRFNGSGGCCAAIDTGAADRESQRANPARTPLRGMGLTGPSGPNTRRNSPDAR
jgi:hypothetical protein